MEQLDHSPIARNPRSSAATSHQCSTGLFNRTHWATIATWPFPVDCVRPKLSSMYPDPKSVSRAMYDRALASLPGGNTRTTVFMKPYPIYAARGEGCRVWDVDGNEYIDCINNFTSLFHGHAHPSLVEAAKRQLALGSAFGLPTGSEIDLAELLASRLPAVDQVRFCNSGTEA